MKYLLLSYIVLASISGTSQGFSKRIAFERNAAATSVMENSQGYLVAVITFDTAMGYFYHAIHLLQIDHQGEILFEKIHGSPGWPLNFNQEAWTPISGNRSVLVAQTVVEDVLSACLIWLDEDGDTLQTATFPSASYNGDPDDFSNWCTPMCASSDTEDNIYYVAQSTATGGSGNNFAVYSVNPQGEMRWSFLYEPLDDSDICRFLQVYNDKLVVIGGAQSAIADPNACTEYILDFDLNGNLLHETVEIVGANGESPQEAIIDENSRTYVCSLDDNMSGNNALIVQLDNNNQILWFKALYDGGWRSAYTTITTDCLGNYLCVGADDVWRPDSSEVDEFLTVVNYSQSGEQQWVRKYTAIDVPGDWHRARKVITTSDNGYIIVGEASDMTLDSQWESEDPIQRPWLLKLDACGCLVPGCEDPLFCDPFALCQDYEVEDYFSFSLDPSQESIFLFVGDAELNNPQFKIFNDMGQLVKQFDTPYHNTTYIASSSGYETGIYFLSLFSDGEPVQTEKVLLR